MSKLFLLCVTYGWETMGLGAIDVKHRPWGRLVSKVKEGNEMGSAAESQVNITS